MFASKILEQLTDIKEYFKILYAHMGRYRASSTV